MAKYGLALIFVWALQCRRGYSEPGRIARSRSQSSGAALVFSPASTTARDGQAPYLAVGAA